MSWITFIAWRYFRSPKKDKFVNLATTISVFTSTFAIAFLIIAFSVFRGYEEALIDKLTKSSGHIMIRDSEEFEYSEIASEVDKFKHEKIVEANGLIATGSTSTNVYLYGSSAYKLQPLESKHIPIIVSKNLADHMHYKPYDIINIIVPVAAPAPFFLLPESITCEIVEIKKFESEDLNHHGIAMNLSDLQNVLNIESKIHKVKCFSKSLSQVDKDHQKLDKLFSKKFVLHWKNINEFFLKVMKSEQNIFFILLLMLMILAAFLFILAIGMFINSKKEDIKILKILGASNGDVCSIFLYYSLIVSSINIILGTLIGLSISFNINKFVKIIEKTFKITIFANDVYLINYIPVSFHTIDIMCILLASFFISFLSSFWVSRKMNKIQ